MSTSTSNHDHSNSKDPFKILEDNKGKHYKSSDSLYLPQGCIVKYSFDASLEHWGIHIGDGYIISKLSTSWLSLEHVSQGDWKRVSYVCLKECYEFAKKAAEILKYSPYSPYHAMSANCQHWVRDVATSTFRSCPDIQDPVGQAGLQLFLHLHPGYYIFKLFGGWD